MRQAGPALGPVERVLGSEGPERSKPAMGLPPAGGEVLSEHPRPPPRGAGLPAPPWGIFVGGPVPGPRYLRTHPSGDQVEATEGTLVSSSNARAVRSGGFSRIPALVGLEIVVDLTLART